MNLEEMKELFKDVDENKLKLLEPLMEETIFLKEQLNELRKLPLIKVHPTNPELQKRTDAGKMFKDYQQAYNNNMKILLSTLNKFDIGEENPILLWLKDKQR